MSQSGPLHVQKTRRTRSIKTTASTVDAHAPPRHESAPIFHMRRPSVLKNAHVVRGNSRLTPNRHCVSCTVDACLLLVIGVPVKSAFRQVRVVGGARD